MEGIKNPSDICKIINNYTMQTFQIQFLYDYWERDKDENFKYLTINCKDLDEVIEYLRKNCTEQYNQLMGDELSVWKHKKNGNVILWHNIFSHETDTYDLNTNKTSVLDWKDNFIKNGGGMTKPPNERPYTKIKLEDLDQEQFKNLTYLILTDLVTDYSEIYLTITYKVNNQFVIYPLDYEEYIFETISDRN